MTEGSIARKFKCICVFGGTNFGKNTEYIIAATHLGQTLAARGINLVYGGGNFGLLGCLSSSARISGCRVLGVILKLIANNKIFGETEGEELGVLSVHEKMASMMYTSDAFIAMPGGLVTLEETFMVASWSQMNFHKKPLGLLNVNGFYDGLLSFLDHAVEQELIPPTARQNIVSAPTADQLIDLLQRHVYQPDPVMSGLNWSKQPRKRKSDMDLTLHL